jgi:hypothetical protein
MAIGLAGSPNPISAVDEPIEFLLTASDMGTPGVTVKSIVWKLEDGLGNITAEDEIRIVNTSYEHPVKLSHIIKENLKTSIPSLFSNTVQNAAGQKLYTFSYGEKTLTIATGGTAGLPVTAATPFRVVNTTNNNYMDHQDIMTAFKLLTRKPFQNFFTHKDFDWIYVWGACTVTLLKNFISSGPDYTGTTVVSLSGSADRVNCIPIGYRHHAGLAGLRQYMVKLALNGQNYYFKFNHNNEPYANCPSQIIYFDPAGGYTALDGEMKALSPLSNKYKAKTYHPHASNTSGGEQLRNSQAIARYSFKRQMPLELDAWEQMIRFVGGENYYIPLQTTTAEGLVRFTFDSDVNIALESLEYFDITGYLTHPVNSANGRQ